MASVTVADGRIRIEQGEGVVVLTFCRPEVRNALDFESMEALGAFVEELGSRPDILAVVFAGEGASFVSGGDLRQLAALKSEEAGRSLSRRGGQILRDLESLPQTTIAAIGGDAYGGGVELALACDMRIIERSSSLGLVQARLGLCTAWGAGVRLQRMLGYARALELLIEAGCVDAQRAWDLGLVNRVVEDGEALPSAVALAAKVVSLTRPVAMGIKAVLKGAEVLDVDDAMAEERRIFGQLWGSELHQEKVAEFLRKSRPR